jgi:hypothetical protein
MSLNLRRLFVAQLIWFCGVVAARSEDLPLLVEDDFDKGMDRWETTDPKGAEPVWKIETVERDGKQDKVLRVTGTSKYEPPHRSPFSIALVKDVVVGDFVMTAKVQNTNPTAGDHRDLCFFWGYQDPAHFYYVHLGARPDPHSCQIFIVNDAPRTMITELTSEGTPWTDGWHQVKVVRRVEEGVVEVYFDDMERPVMRAKDKTFTWGRVGLGTFDDHGNFDEFRLQGERVERE